MVCLWRTSQPIRATPNPSTVLTICPGRARMPKPHTIVLLGHQNMHPGSDLLSMQSRLMGKVRGADKALHTVQQTHNIVTNKAVVRDVPKLHIRVCLVEDLITWLALPGFHRMGGKHLSSTHVGQPWQSHCRLQRLGTLRLLSWPQPSKTVPNTTMKSKMGQKRQ